MPLIAIIISGFIYTRIIPSLTKYSIPFAKTSGRKETNDKNPTSDRIINCDLPTSSF